VTHWPWPERQVFAPHDFVVREVLDRSILLTRVKTGCPCFLNYCRHAEHDLRGMWKCQTVHLPYHAWTYDSAGRLVGIPGKEGLPVSIRRSTGSSNSRLRSGTGYLGGAHRDVDDRCCGPPRIAGRGVFQVGYETMGT